MDSTMIALLIYKVIIYPHLFVEADRQQQCKTAALPLQ